MHLGKRSLLGFTLVEFRSPSTTAEMARENVNDSLFLRSIFIIFQDKPLDPVFEKGIFKFKAMIKNCSRKSISFNILCFFFETQILKTFLNFLNNFFRFHGFLHIIKRPRCTLAMRKI